MHPLRRVVGLLTGVLVLQLTLLGAAAPCTESAGSGAAHAAMLADADAVSGEQMHSAEPVADTGREDCAEHADKPGSPTGSGAPSCIAMISCVTPLLQLAGEPSLSGGLLISGVVSAPDLVPPTRNTLPELPPPRA